MSSLLAPQSGGQPRSAPSSRIAPAKCLESDITQSTTFLNVRERHEEYLLPGQNEAVDFAQVRHSPDGKRIAGIATICKELKGSPATSLAIIDVHDGQLSTFGSRTGFDGRPEWSPDGKLLSFLSQVNSTFQLHLLHLETEQVEVVTQLKGSVEQQLWSQDGKSILLLVAGLGADKAGAEGGVSIHKDSQHDADKKWTPTIETNQASDSYRNAWIFDVATRSSKQATPENINIWSVAWISDSSVVGICSDLPGEEHWYRSTIRQISLGSEAVEELYKSDDPVEMLKASPSGALVAFTTGVASDRYVMRGDLCILEVSTGKVTRGNTNGVNIGFLEWSSDDEVVAAGSRDGEEVITSYNISTGSAVEMWKSSSHSIGANWVPEMTVHRGRELQCAFVRSGWFSRPTLVQVSNTTCRDIKEFSSSDLEQRLQGLGTFQNISWQAPDGLKINGFFLAPSTPGPHPTVMFIHGGPVGEWRCRYLGQPGHSVLAQILLEAGFAVFEPNVRGSSGRGQDFSRYVFGDMGGLDTHDYLSGLDALVKSGKVDGNRLGVYGGSYGGYMSSWLITQTDRFAAAVPLAPVTDWVSEHYTSHIGQFCLDFLADDPHNFGGKYFTRSPLHYVRNVQTPALVICGALDKNTPPGQALEFHRALVANGKLSVLLTYPEEGHGVRQMPACFDMAARVVDWFRHFL